MNATNESATVKKSPILQWLISKKLHIIVWIIFIFYESIIVGLINGKFGSLPPYILYYTLNIITFYVHAHVVLTFGFKNPKQTFWKLPIALALEIVCYLLMAILLDYIIIYHTHYTGSRKITLDLQYFSSPLYRCVYFMCFSTGYYFLLNYIKERKKTEELEKQRLNNLIQIARSENAFLKAQIQPHLLFNTLDFIYQNARESSPVAAEAIHSLSEMMRYSVDSNKDREFILLDEEINQVENLINLHQLRKDHSIQLRFGYDDGIRNLKIIPMVLITLVENIFKHGELFKISDPAEVSVRIEDGHLIIETSNLVNTVKDHSGLSSGLENIKKRLDYTYGKNASFSYFTDKNNYFRVKLQIGLNG
ncbi:sensor histidine kinase [Pedobacter sp. UBA5917]|jgi:sensor histidine kinase YesM|uniref:sensor histidine kinase n=1 Tax=Pedobacter sp. UBA5917 TaxID=1947061 RepID=UPI0025FF14DF|nr:histidine kinase [Pedobacter sp. UBA5917]